MKNPNSRFPGPGGCVCKGCKDREIGCHGKCERYKAWRKKLDEMRKKEREYKESQNTMSESFIRLIIQDRKNRKYRRRDYTPYE